MMVIAVFASFCDLNDTVPTFGCSDEGTLDLAFSFSITAGAFGITSQKSPILQLDDVFARKACPHIIFNTSDSLLELLFVFQKLVFDRFVQQYQLCFAFRAFTLPVAGKVTSSYER